MKMIKITCSETIKPSSPTPPHLRSYKLSLLDQLVPTIFQPLLLFYPTTNSNADALERCRLLRASLSTFLTQYYPFAGRLIGNVSVECNDEGVYYSEADAMFPLVEVLKEPDSITMSRLTPPQPRGHGTDDPLFLVQVTLFTCGGLSLGVCVSHKISDTASTAAVISAWADSACGDHENRDRPALFLPESVFPPIDNFPTEKSAEFIKEERSIVARRYVFKKSSMESLKAMATSEEVPYPSRVEVISALLWKHVIRALRLKLGVHRPISVIWPVSIRARLVPSLGPRTFGNICIPMVMESQDEGKEELKLSKLVTLMRGGVKEIDKKYRREMGTEELTGVIFNSYTEVGMAMKKSGEIDFHGHTSWCKFPLYDANFGCGKPTWVTVPYISMANTVVIMDSKEADEVEAWVSFEDEDKHIFEQDENLLKFASLNPSVV